MSDHETTLRELAEVLDRQNYAAYRVAACLAGADALRRTCGTCANFTQFSYPIRVSRGACSVFSSMRDIDDGCIKGYAPKEVSRG